MLGSPSAKDVTLVKQNDSANINAAAFLSIFFNITCHLQKFERRLCQRPLLCLSEVADFVAVFIHIVGIFSLTSAAVICYPAEAVDVYLAVLFLAMLGSIRRLFV